MPTFLIIGAMKAGTTSLYRYLSDHPQVFVSEAKEPDFFVADRNWGKGLAWYSDLFAEAGDAVAIGEASTNYSKFPNFAGVPARIASVLPQVRLVYLVRNPIDRIRSHYLHMYRREKRPLEQLLRTSPHYLNVSRYAMQLDQYIVHFPREQLLVLTSDGLRDSREETIRRVFQFIGVDPTYLPGALAREFNRASDHRVHRPLAWKVRRIPGSRRLAGAAPSFVKDLYRRVAVEEVDEDLATISEETRAWAEDQLREDVSRLRAYLGEGFDGWGIA